MRYDGKWQTGYDVAIIAIPETAARSESLAFNEYEWGDSYPDSASVNGYPMMTNNTVINLLRKKPKPEIKLV